MLEQYGRIYHIQNIDVLTEMKEKLKDDVKDPTLKWDQRMEIYQVIQKINHWIEELREQNTLWQ